MKIVSREAWGAHYATGAVNRAAWTARKGVVFHHTTGPATQTPRDIQRVHQEGRHWFDVGYNFLIGRDGTIYEGRGWTSVGAHCEGHNTETLGFAFIGDYRDGHDDFTADMQAAGAWLYREAVRRRRATLAYQGHQEMSGASTACPGHQVMRWIRAHGPTIGGGTTAPAPGKHTKDDDSSWTEHLMKDLPVLRRNVAGKNVTRCQALLNIDGANPRLALDGDFGPLTEGAVKDSQTRHKLDRDGIVGPKTWAALLGV